MSHGKWVLLGITGVVLVFVGFGVWNRAQPGQYDQFAQCVADRGATFFGAFWCPHCQDQKALFGNSAKLLPYKECSTPNGQGQLAVCDEEGISSYPTWRFGDGSELTGVQSFQTLADKTNCALPQ